MMKIIVCATDDYGLGGGLQGFRSNPDGSKYFFVGTNGAVVNVFEFERN